MSDTGLYFNIISNKIRRKIDNTISSLGISAMQGRIICYIYNKSKTKDIFQKDLEEHFELRGASITSIIQNLLKNEIIIRESVSYDQRLKKLTLSDKGINMEQKIKKIINSIEDEAFSVLSSEETKQMDKLLKKVMENILNF